MLSVIVDDSRDPAWNQALDEALLRACEPAPPGSEGGAPRRLAVAGPPAARPYRSAPTSVLRIWQNAPSVVVGRFQNVARTVDLATCARDGVRLVRRASGGGAVYLDSGTLVFSLVRRTAAGPARYAGPFPEARPDLDTLVLSALEGFDLPAVVLRDGIVRTARMRTRGAVLTHVAVQVTQVGPFGRRYLAEGEGRTLTSLGLDASLDAVRAAVLSAVVDVYGIGAARRPDARERALQEYLYGVRYGDVTWNLTGLCGARRTVEAVRRHDGGVLNAG
ncbi:biotin/lipoate A/B protein ligase family protein [Spirillospora sp. NPDC050679]